MAKIYLLYTGGTFGMDYQIPGNPQTPLVAQPFYKLLPKLSEFEFLGNITKFQRQLSTFQYAKIKVHCDSLAKPVDSSDIHPADWSQLANIIAKVYSHYDGFVIIHGTDTMAYSASALSFMLQSLSKAVILTGADFPLLFENSDAYSNLKLSLKVVLQPELQNNVWIAFNDKITLGNRSTKMGVVGGGFPNLKNPIIANSPVAGKNTKGKAFNVSPAIQSGVMPIYLSPSFDDSALHNLLQNKACHSFVFMTYGSGNCPLTDGYRQAIKQALAEGKIIANISQTPAGKTKKSAYSANLNAIDERILDLKTMTIEAAVTKLMWAKANLEDSAIKNFMENDQCGELA